MRFQQLKRDPNSVMRKKLVKSKKAWVVVSSLSIAGGLLMMTAPSYVAKAEVTNGAPSVQATLTSTAPPSSTGTTSQDSSKTAPATSAPAPTTPVVSSGSGSSSKTTETPADKPVAVEGDTEVKSAEVITDSTKESTPETTPKETTPTTVVEKPTVKDAPVEAPSTGTETTTPVVAALSAVAPTAGVEQETTVPDGSTDGKTDVTPADSETPATGDGVNDVKTPLDVSTLTGSKLMSLMVPADTNLLNANLTDSAADTNSLATPVAEVATVPVPDVDDKGTGWTYTSASKNLDINGPLTDFKAGDTDHWNGHTSTITNVTISNPVIAPKDTSYMFANMVNVTSITDLDKLDTSNTTTMEGMFKGDEKLTDLNLSNSNLSQAENISHMFEDDSQLTTIEFSKSTGFKHIVNASYTFANCSDLKDLSAMTTWQASNATDLRAMFKNASSLTSLNLGVLNWSLNIGSTNADTNGMPNTGDSSIGEGMFDGTNLTTISLPKQMYFSPKTALTSLSGSQWVSQSGGKSFNGVPTFDSNGNATGGIGSVFDGSNSGILKNDYSVVASPNGTAVSNLITIKTNRGNITFAATGNVGEMSTVNVPDTFKFEDGNTYTRTSDPTVDVTFGQTQATAPGEATYVGVEISDGTANISTSDGEKTVNNITGHVGDSVIVEVPTKAGYTPDKTTVSGIMQSDGSVKVTESVTYTINPTKPTYSTSLGTAGGSTDITVPSIYKIGDKVQLTVPPVDGYTSPVYVDGTIDENGNFVPNDPETPIYTGKPTTTPYTTSLGANGTKDIPMSSNAKVGDKVQLTVPPVDGYTSPVYVDGTIDEKGNFVPNNPETPIYTGKPTTTPYTTTLGADGTKDIPMSSNAKVGDKVQLTVPPVDGYTSPVYVDGTIDQNGNFVPNDPKATIYTGVKNSAQKLILKNPDGTTSEFTIPEGKYGDTPRTITANAISGYSAPAVIVTYNADGTSTITDANDPKKALKNDDVISYTRKSSGNSIEPVDPDEGVIEQKNQTISTYADKPDVEIYQLGSDNKMTQITNRVLATASNWYSDTTVTIDGVSYYRVATNEWAKMSQTYPYQALNLHIRTYNDSEKTLYKAENIVISNETLAPSSSWITDRETYVINNTKYYRVATNEFVNADDVYVYSPVSMVVTTHANQYTTVYNAKGAAVTDRSLNSDSSWKVDSITYINGDKYYRVATNEFVKASDVDINTLR
ncbi:SLAP domain-containing protein [Companilactobacillus muriivasis]|uniref:SLAP domain-containing protein n=1 Tax=Companilactobacillus muriivasis TaxID=3081444 RepID=UPI0030C76EAE